MGRINILDGSTFAAGTAKLEARMRAATGSDGSVIKVAALELERAIKLVLSHPGTGRTYGKHQASAPGEPPAVDTGILRNTIGTESLGGVIRIGSGQEYAPILEYGSGLARIAPRPFMRPALESVKERMTGLVIAELRRADVGRK